MYVQSVIIHKAILKERQTIFKKVQKPFFNIKVIIMNKEKIEKAVYDLLEAIGEDPNREGLIDTPKRVAKMYQELLTPEIIKYTTFQDKYDDIVMVRDIQFTSICEHHLLPFYGKAHIAYIPNGKIIGLSKLARVVEKHSKKLQVQERMTMEILQELKNQLNTEDIAIFIEAKHMCMIARGIKKELSNTVTIKLNGVFKKERKDDFYNLLNK